MLDDDRGGVVARLAAVCNRLILGQGSKESTNKCIASAVCVNDFGEFMLCAHLQCAPQPPGKEESQTSRRRRRRRLIHALRRRDMMHLIVHGLISHSAIPKRDLASLDLRA